LVNLENSKEKNIILALDTHSLNDAFRILDLAGDDLKYVKVGYRLYFLGGIDFISKLQSRGYCVFLDLKLHDIPNTVSIALEPLMDMGLWSITLHSAGGRAMLEQAAAARNRSGTKTRLFGVTVLTSHSDISWQEVNPGASISSTLLSRAVLCENCGLDGLVCAPSDLPLLDSSVSRDLDRIVPGIRLKDTTDDQQRSKSPFDAIKDGADYLVVGRPVLNSPSPGNVIQTIRNQIREAENEIL